MVITGTSRDDLNGQAGAATSFDHERGRYVVELDGDTDGDARGEAEKAKLKQELKNFVFWGTKGKGRKGNEPPWRPNPRFRHN